jgi:integrase
MIYKRGKYYHYSFEFGGKRYRKSTDILIGKGRPGEKSPKELARDVETAKRHELALAAAGIVQPPPPPPEEPEPEKPTLSVWAAQWLTTHAQVYCKFATHRLYKQVVRDHLEPALGNKKLDEITREDIRLLIAQKVNEKLSKATVRNIIAPLRQMLGHAVDEEIISSNPARKLGRFSKETSAKANAKKIVPYTAEEVQILLQRAEQRSFDLHVFLLTAVLTGMRLGELLGLQWGDLDIISKCIHVKRAVTRRRIETPKNHLQRPIDMSDELLRNLQELQRRRKEEWFGKGKKMPEWVFCDEDGDFTNEYNFRKRKFYPLFKKKGEDSSLDLRQIRLHDLRHTYASLMLQQGESVTYVKEQMGHHSIQVTVDLYGHLIPGANRAAANRLQARILPASRSVGVAQA